MSEKEREESGGKRKREEIERKRAGKREGWAAPGLARLDGQHGQGRRRGGRYGLVGASGEGGGGSGFVVWVLLLEVNEEGDGSGVSEAAKGLNQAAKVDWPFIVKIVFPHEVVETSDLKNRNDFKVNGQRLKPFSESMLVD